MFLTLRGLLVSNGLALALLALCQPVSADDEFNLRILELDTPLENTSTLESYIKNNGLVPGNYPTTLMWGKAIVDKRTLSYALSEDKQRLVPALTKADLRQFGVKVDSIPGMKGMEETARVDDISRFIHDARYDVNLDEQTLNLVIPQLYHDETAANEVDIKNWDDGASAAWVSYQLSGSQQQFTSGKTTSTWLGLNSGLNFGAWRLRNASNWSNSSGWDAVSTSLQRDIKPLKSQLEIGQASTNGELFDSVQMVGVKLETDSSMLPLNQQGFAPVVRGIANSDAKVTIKQNGYTIYQSNVSPGPFEIRDLSQVTAGSDLEVSVEEADGTVRSFIQASASVPVLQREGTFKYAFAAGKYRGNEGEVQPEFVQATANYGLPYGVTVYSGGLGASFYDAALAGIGADMGRFGSASVDVTFARTSLDYGRGEANGMSWRTQYTKDLPDTGTTLSLASYRYSTSGFYTFQEAIDQHSQSDDRDIYAYRRENNRRSRLQVNLSQTLGGMGTIYLNAYQQNYWDLEGQERSVNAGFSSSWRDVSWSVNYGLTKTPDQENDQQIAFSVNIPLAHWLANSWATYSMNTSRHGSTSHQVGLGGTALEDNNLSYNLQQSYTSTNTGYGASVSGRYRGSSGEVGAGYSYSGNNKQWNYTAQGSLVAHEHGVTAGQTVRDAFAIVHIADGDNVKVQNGRGIYTDRFGNAIVPTLTAYRQNAITVNTQDREDIDIDAATQNLIPTKGAAVPALFDARVGRRALVSLRFQGRPIPFGAIVTLEGATAIVGDEGEVYLSGLRGTTSFHVQWGDDYEHQCSGTLAVPNDHNTGIFKAATVCH